MRHLLLHPEGEFIALDHALDVGIKAVISQRLAVKRLQQVEFGELNLRADRRMDIADFGVGDGAIIGADARALIDCREKRRSLAARPAKAR